MLSKIHRRAEALDEACLRAWGHPRDHAVQQELLSALEWDSSLHPEHARPVIRELFVEVHDQSLDLSVRIRATADDPESAAKQIKQGVQGLRQRLGDLIRVLQARNAEPRSN
jgi:hypothetical protein